MAGSFSLDELTDEQRKKLLEDFAPGPLAAGPMARGAQGFAPLPLPKGLGGAFESTPSARSGIEPDLFARFAAAQQRGSKLDALNALGHGFGADAALIAGTGVNTISREPGRRGQPVAELSANLNAERSIKQMDRQKELDAVNLAKTRADTRKSEVTATASEADAKREAALADPTSPESTALRATASELLKGRISPETLATMSGVQLREALKFGTSMVNAEAMAQFRSEQLAQQDENAAAARRMQAFALQQGWDLAKLTLEQRERLAQMEAEAKAAAAAKEATSKTTERESSIRKEFQALEEVKTLPGVEAAHRNLMSAQNDMTGFGATTMIFNVMKMLDPGVSVMQGDIDLVKKAGGPLARYANMYEEVKSGNTLSPEVRADIVRSANLILASKRKAAADRAAEYSALAGQYGLDPKRVVLSSGLRGEPSAEAPLPPGIKSSTRPTKPPSPGGTKPKVPEKPSRPDKKLDPTKKVVNTTTSSDGTLFREDYEDGTYGLKRIKKSDK